MAYKYPICDVFHWLCKITRFFATEPLANSKDVKDTYTALRVYQRNPAKDQEKLDSIDHSINELLRLVNRDIEILESKFEELIK